MKKAIIADLDGTLAILNGRNPYKQGTCDQDLVNDDVRGLLKIMETFGYKILFLTGRSEDCRDKTEAWLNKVGFTDFVLYMRSLNDKRPAEVFKKDVYQNGIQKSYDVLFVIEDSIENVTMFRYLGVPCLFVE